MTHMHIPDGILPLWLWGGGFAVTAALLALCLFRLRGMDHRKGIPLLGALSAAMLVAMNLEIFPLAYHLNLSVAAGILLGPSLGFIAAFIVNIMLALVGHGGITVMGLNTLLLGAEEFFGHTVFFLLPSTVPVFWRGAAATVVALLLVSLILIAIVGASHAEVEAFLHDHEGKDAGGPEARTSASLRTFAVMVLTLGAIGWVIEGAVTGAVIRFISRVKPDLLSHVLHGASAERRP